MQSEKMPNVSSAETYFSNETIQSLRELGAVLATIHKRLVGEGYIIKNGKIFKNGELITGYEKCPPGREGHTEGHR